MNSFTPGPWHPGHFGGDGTCQCKSVVSEGYAGSVCTISVDNGLRIGEGGNDSPPRDEAIANMHLISSAPELLECLKEARRLLTDQDAIDLAHIDEVIAKAEGTVSRVEKAEEVA